MKKFTTKPRVFRSNPGYVGTHNYQSKGWVYLGRLGEAGPLTDVRFDTDMAHVVALFGKRGSGKSYTLGTLLEGLCTCEAESSIAVNPGKSAILLFDTLGVFQWMSILLHKNSQKAILKEQFAVRRGWPLKAEPLDVAVWIPKGSRTPGTPAEHHEFTINCSDFAAEDWGYLFGLDIYQDRMGQLLNDAFIKVTQEGWSDSQRRHQPGVQYSINDLIACMRATASCWRPTTMRPGGWWLAVDDVPSQSVFKDRATSLRNSLKPGRMSVIVMNKMSDELRLIVVSALMRRLIASRVQASEAEKHLKIIEDFSPSERQALEQVSAAAAPQTWVAIDKAQNILPSERRTSATDVIVKYVREGRNYGLFFVSLRSNPPRLTRESWLG